MIKVELILSPSADLYHSSLLVSGLARLAETDEIALVLRRPRGRSEARLAADQLAIPLIVHTPLRGRSRIAVIELRDRSDLFAADALAGCDVYFKRSYHEPDLDGLEPELATKVVPFGLNFACRTPRATARVFRTVGPQVAARGVSGLKRLRHFLSLPDLSTFEQDVSSEVDETVVFQTRVWNQDEAADGEAVLLNRERVDVVRALRAAFGSRYRGGLVPTALARAAYPGEVTSQPARRGEYTAMSRRNLIGVYTRGLFHSTAFKLAEYLAGAQCIVAEPPRNELPEPLVEGKHYLAFRTPAECVAACERLLGDPGLASSMRKANREYYLSQVCPEARLRWVVRQAAFWPVNETGVRRRYHQHEASVPA